MKILVHVAMFGGGASSAYVAYNMVQQYGKDNCILYELGFSHANCAGRCVRGGFQHYAQLYKVWPERYALQEEMEENFRKHFEKNVSILKKNGGPYTLKQYREQMDREGIDKFLKTPDDTVPCVCSFS